jgi:hypothetical protein
MGDIMIGALMGLPGKCKAIYDYLTTNLSATRAGYIDRLDVAISTRAAASDWSPALATELGGLDTSIAAIPTTPINSILYYTVTIADGGTTGTRSITSVTAAKSALLYLGSTCTGTLTGAHFGWLALTSGTLVTATRAGSAGTLTIGFCVVEFK